MEKLPRDVPERRLPLPVGKSDWEEVAGHCYCVDKTLLIRDLLAVRTGVALFTRPRRFGKTTAISKIWRVPSDFSRVRSMHITAKSRLC